mgnify:CR=1 FL=1
MTVFSVFCGSNSSWSSQTHPGLFYCILTISISTTPKSFKVRPVSLCEIGNPLVSNMRAPYTYHSHTYVKVSHAFHLHFAQPFYTFAVYLIVICMLGSVLRYSWVKLAKYLVLTSIFMLRIKLDPNYRQLKFLQTPLKKGSNPFPVILLCSSSIIKYITLMFAETAIHSQRGNLFLNLLFNYGLRYLIFYLN